MGERRILDSDVVKVYTKGEKRSAETLLATLFWGDVVNVTGSGAGGHDVEMVRRVGTDSDGLPVLKKSTGVLPKGVRFRDGGLLKVKFVDVGQGDGAIVETPAGQVVLIDGGEEHHLRNYVNVAYAHVLKTKPLPVSAIVVTHGDADHFSGLTKLANADRKKGQPAISVDRVFHNGLVKGPAAGTATFGKTVKKDGRVYVVDLEDDLLKVPDGRMNTPFLSWKKALARLRKAVKSLKIERLEYGDDAAFDFLGPEGIEVQVLGPLVETVAKKPALPFLRTPGSSSLSASHTVNGHSVVLRLTYENVRFLFGADLNEEAEESLLAKSRESGVSLAAEILKVPHHGSADFSPGVLEAIRPVVSVVSSGDENPSKEYIHPRAGLVGALGKYSRTTVEKPLVYVTEMVAFFARMGEVTASQDAALFSNGKALRDASKNAVTRIHNAYRKKAFGIVHVRTDGSRVLVATHSGKDDQKEAYAFHVDANGAVTFEDKVRVL
jgi:hypothetical protein